MLHALSTQRLRLRPINGPVDDGRAVIYLASAINTDDVIDSVVSGPAASRDVVLGHVIIGRTSRDKPNAFCVRDPRVSRRHVRVDVGADGHELHVFITAIGANPIEKLHAVADSGEGGESYAGLASSNGLSANSGVTIWRRKELSQGERAELRVGDQVALVVEEKVAASGPSLDFKSNACIYVLEAGAEKRTQEGAAASSSEGVEAPPAKVARSAAPTDGPNGDSPNSENREPQAKFEQLPEGCHEPGMSQEDPIVL